MKHNSPTPFLGAPSAAESALEDVSSLRMFVQTLELGSFSEVARRLGATPAMVSKRIAGLENRLGQRLLNRNTRELFPTEAGQRLYERAVRALAELDLAAAEISDLRDIPTGNLRVTAPALLGAAYIGPHVGGFLMRYPAISLSLDFSSPRLDLFQQRIDVAVRIADTIDPGMIAIKLAPYRRIFCASPNYLAERGEPVEPRDLLQHNCLVASGATPNNSWPMQSGEKVEHISVRGTLTSDNSVTVRSAAVEGVGVMMAPQWLVQDQLRANTLVQILPAFSPPEKTVYAVLLQRTDTSRKLAAVVDFLKACFSVLT